MNLQHFSIVYLDIPTKYTKKRWIKFSSLEIIRILVVFLNIGKEIGGFSTDSSTEFDFSRCFCNRVS